MRGAFDRDGWRDMDLGYDFSAGPPDVSHLGTKERLAVMREYRRYKEQGTTFDFEMGPPDVSQLEGEERLAVLRQYRHWKQSKDGAFGPGGVESTQRVLPAGVMCARTDDVPTPRAVMAQQALYAPVPWQQEVPDGGVPALALEQLNVSDAEAASAAAGVRSGAHGSIYTYFERPLTARDSERVPPTATQPEPPPPPTPRTIALMEEAARLEASTGAAGVATGAQNTAWLGAWLDQDTPRNCRRLAPKEGGLTEQRIFATEFAPDESLAEHTAQVHAEQLRARQAAMEAEHAAKLAAVERGPVAGVATQLEQVYAPCAYPPQQGGEWATAESQVVDTEPATPMLPPPPPVPGLPMAPDTVGMSRGAALEAKRAWRLQLSDRPVTAEPSPRSSCNIMAGMSSDYSSRSCARHRPTPRAFTRCSLGP